MQVFQVVFGELFKQPGCARLTLHPGLIHPDTMSLQSISLQSISLQSMSPQSTGSILRF